MNEHALRFDRSYRETLTLGDGQRVSLRLLRPTDKLGIRQGMARMSSESRYMRFMTNRKDLNEAELRNLTELDGVDHFAVGAVAIHPDGTEDGVAVVRFVRLRDEPEVAEPAIAVIDSYQGRGLGKAMLWRLASAARERGIRRFRCTFLSSNRRIRKLLTGMAVNPTFHSEREVVTMEFDLPLAVSAGRGVALGLVQGGLPSPG